MVQLLYSAAVDGIDNSEGTAQVTFFAVDVNHVSHDDDEGVMRSGK